MGIAKVNIVWGKSQEENEKKEGFFSLDSGIANRLPSLMTNNETYKRFFGIIVN